MVLLEYDGKKPIINENAYVSPLATLIGDVVINNNVVIWPGSIIRAEKAQINIGEYSTIFDGVSLFTRSQKSPIHIGRYCILETGVTLLGGFLEDYVQIMEGSIIFEECSIGEGAVILNKSQVPPGLIIPARAVMKGIPVETIREQSRKDVLEQKERADHYTQLFIKINKMLPNAQGYLLTLPDFIKMLMKKEKEGKGGEIP
jgi:carbonic anhydrase/acetyltransferase-like protein (isoleucine patch superfamily)